MYNYSKHRYSPVELVAFYMLVGFILLCIYSYFFIGKPVPFSAPVMIPPSWKSGGNMVYFLGTDKLGRDIFSLLLGSTLPTLFYAALTTIAIAIITFLLSLMRFYFALLYALIQLAMNILYTIPALLIAAAIALIIGNSYYTLMLAILLASLPRVLNNFSFVLDSETKKEYVLAAKLDGASTWQTLIYSVMPNCLPACIKALSTLFTLVLLDFTTLCFLGFGQQENTNDWGSLMRNQLTLINTNPWAFTLTGLTLLAVILIVYVLKLHLIQRCKR